MSYHSTRNPEVRVWTIWIGGHVAWTEGAAARRRRLTSTSSSYRPLRRPAALLHQTANSSISNSMASLFMHRCFERLQETNAFLASILAAKNGRRNKQPFKYERYQSVQFVQKKEDCSPIRPSSWEQTDFIKKQMVWQSRLDAVCKSANWPIGGNSLNRCPPIHIFWDLNSGFLVEWVVGE